jgi:hypothetical protein
MLLVGLVSVGGTTAVFATTSSSNNYQVVETEFGAGSSLESCSDEYCARTIMGSLAVGGSASGEQTAEFGPITEDQPAIDVIIEAGQDSDLGVLTTTSTATATMTVKVRNYLSNGYVMQIVGDSPTYSGHALATPLAPTASAQGTEQFAINAVANTTPSVGASPVQVPSGDFSFGTVEPGYGTPNEFQYTNGDVVGRSLSETGRTDYTISMIINVAGSTPAGRYSGNFTAVVIPGY